MFRFLRVLTVSILALGLSFMYDVDSKTGTLWSNKAEVDYVLILDGEEAALYDSEGNVYETSRDEINELIHGIIQSVPKLIGQGI